ncbi:MAG: tRNA-intron lyase [Thermoplasmata archaeon]|nr:tRNA-intron lyase [Thermoplasmata archaeon]
MPGELEGAIVFIRDEKEANRVHNKGYPGRPLSGGGLMLGLLEAAFLMDEKDFQIAGLESILDLFDHAAKYLRDFEASYLVYREVKLRGFIIKLPDAHFDLDAKELPTGYFRLLPRGAGPSLPAIIYALPIPERAPFQIERFLSFSEEAKKKGVESLVGVVDEDGDVTFYSLRLISPTGDCKEPDIPILQGVPVHNRVMVPLNKDSKILHREGFFGRPMGSMLHLSLIEARYLLGKGLLRVDGVSLEQFDEWAGKGQPDFPLRYPAYRDLRERGLRVKTGFKYGTHFRAYSSDPELTHADFLVHLYPDGARLDWQEIGRGVRVAHGVKKRMVFSTPSLAEGGMFLELAWVRP